MTRAVDRGTPAASVKTGNAMAMGNIAGTAFPYSPLPFILRPISFLAE